MVSAPALLRWSGIAFAGTFFLHGADHARRGLEASPPSVLWIGTIQAVFVIVATWLAWKGSRRAPLVAALVGLASVLLVTFGHLLPASPPVGSDSFVSPPHTNVNVFSWVSALGEVCAAVAFGLAGIFAVRR